MTLKVLVKVLSFVLIDAVATTELISLIMMY